MASIAFVVLAATLALLTGTSDANPWYWAEGSGDVGYKAPSCTAHPTSTQRLGRHGTPQPDASVSYLLLDSSKAAVQKVCPGGSYTMQIKFPNSGAEVYVTSSIGAFKTGYAPKCPNQAANPVAGSGGPDRQTYQDTLSLDCTASGSVILMATHAYAERESLLQSSATYVVDSSCAVAPCSSGSNPVALGSPPPVTVGSPPPTPKSSPPTKATSPAPKRVSSPRKAKSHPPAKKKSPPPPKKKKSPPPPRSTGKL